MPHVPRNKLFYPNASQVDFIPSIITDWVLSPINVQVALDEIAGRVYKIEMEGITDASFITYTPSEDVFSCWNGSSDPGSVADALDQVALRLCDIEANPILYYIFDIHISHPQNPSIGQFYYNTINQLAYYFNGETWIPMSSSGGGGLTNIDGGAADTIYGGTTGVDGGGA